MLLAVRKGCVVGNFVFEPQKEGACIVFAL